MPRKLINERRLSQAEEFPGIKGFQEITLIDWDGKIASIIFLSGCNFRCKFCHSRSLVLEEDGLESISFSKITSFLKEKAGWIDGVVITGGEPTLDPEKLFALITEIKDIGLGVKLDTNGTNPGTLSRLLNAEMINYLSMDIKSPLLSENYSKATSVKVNIDDIIRSKELIINSDIDYEFRTTVIPGLITTSDIADIAKSIAGAKKYCLQQFVPRDTIDPSFLDLKPYPSDRLKQMAAVASEYLPNVIIRNS